MQNNDCHIRLQRAAKMVTGRRLISSLSFYPLIGILFAFLPELSAQYISSEPVLWLTPDSPLETEEGLVSQWGSEIGAEALLQSDPGLRPLVNPSELQLAGSRTILFSGNEFLEAPINVPQPVTVFSVFRPESGSQTFLYDTPSRYFLFCTPPNSIKPGILPAYPSPLPNDYFIISAHRAIEGYSWFYENGELKVEGNEVRSVNGNFRLGISVTDDREFVGSVAEVIIYNQALSQEQVDSVVFQLKNKYAPPPDLGGVRNLLPGCTVSLVAENRFKTYQWFEIESGGEEVLLAGGDTLLQVNTPGQYVLEVTTIFDDIRRDTVEVTMPLPDELSGTFCAGNAHEVNTGITDDSVIIEWSEPGWEGPFWFVDTAGEYSVTLLQSDGCEYSVDFEVADIDEVAEIIVPEVFCAGNQIGVNPLYAPGLDILWSNGSTDLAIAPEADGQYWVEVANQNDCAASDTVEIAVAGSAPLVNFEVGPLCAGEQVSFTDLSETVDGSGIVQVNWSIDEMGLTGSEVVYQFESPGFYPLQMWVETDAGCSGQLSTTLEVFALPEPAFSNGLACAGSLVLFEDESTVPGGQITDWSWNFAGTVIEGMSAATHAFSSPGLQSVTLTVTSNEGCAAAISGEIEVNPSPEVSFEWNAACEGNLMLLQSTTSTDITGPLNYAWNLGGVVVSGPAVQHLFPGAGDFNATLEAWTTIDGLPGCFGAHSEVVSVYAPPEAEFENTPACAGQPVTFSDLTEANQDDEVISRTWSSSGIPIDTTESFVWVFNEPGLYQVSLEVETEAGCTAQVVQEITVGAGIPPQIVFTPEIGLPPLEVSFSNPNTYGQTHWWDFGDGGFSTEEFPVHTYQDTGSFVIDLLVFDEAGCSGGATADIQVTAPVFDIAVEDVFCQTDDQLVTVSAVVANYNNHRLNSFEIRVNLGNGTVVSEFWQSDSAPLEPGELTTFVFGSLLNYDPEVNDPYLCVSVHKPNGSAEDVSPGNNRMCKSLEDTGAFEIYSPYPNPAKAFVIQPFYLKTQGEVLWQLIRADGKLIFSRTENYSAGYNEFVLDIQAQSAGTYMLRGQFEEDIFTHRVVIIKNE
jgi:PKD repeat protein